MDIKAPVWKLFTALLVAAIPAIIAAYATISVYERGPIPEKRLELQIIGPFDPLSDLADLGDRVSLTVSVDNKSYNNISAWTFHIQNAGGVPILPSDMYESFTVSVPAPWSIISVDAAYPGVNQVQVKWTRRDERTFVAEPLLLNPGDRFYYRVYVTDPQYQRENARDSRVLREPTVTARIANMRGFAKAITPLDRYRLPQGLVVIYLDGWAVPFALLAACLLLSWYLVMLRRTRFLRATRNQALLLTVGAALLAFSVAEVFAYYVFGGYPLLDMFEPSKLDWHTQFTNWAILVLHILVSAYLYLKTRSTG